MIQYCLFCRKEIETPFETDYCSKKCYEQDVKKKLTKTWTSVSVRKSTIQKIRKIQESLNDKTRKTDGISEIIEYLIETISNHGDPVKIILKDIFKMEK